MTIRILDVVFSAVGIMVTWPLLLVISVLSYLELGAPILRQVRVGRHRRPFVLLKFRTMFLDTPETASHLVRASAVTRLGKFLRRSKLDELPQLWNVLRGEMSFVGPRPCLLTQFDLIVARDARGVFNVRPGITGLAQISGVDMSNLDQIVVLDSQMIRELNVALYCKYIFLTLIGRGGGDRVRG